MGPPRLSRREDPARRSVGPVAGDLATHFQLTTYVVKVPGNVHNLYKSHVEG